MGEHISEHIKAVFFDHDDTLVGTISPKWKQHKFIAKTHYDKNLTDEELRQHWGKPLKELMRLLYDTTDVDGALEHVYACHKDYPKELFEATVPTLSRIKDQGKLVGIITATARFSFEHDLNLHKVPRGLIDYTQAEDDTPYHKPNPKVFDPAVRWLKSKHIKPSEVIYVGDGLQDMRAALGAGFNFVGVETGLITANQFSAEGAKSIPSLAELLK